MQRLLALSLTLLALFPGISQAQYEAGACCFDGGYCVVLSLEECYAAPGASHWIGNVFCDPNPCPVTPLLACCLPDGSCTVMNYLECGDSGGMAQQWGGCDPYPCEEHLQACCLADGSCDLLIPPVCEYLGGQPLEETSCIPDPCVPAPLGACCIVPGTCVVMTFDDCHLTADSYAWLGDQPCNPNPCPNTPLVACCFADGHCEHIPDFECVNQGGYSAGYWIDCDPDPCGPTPVEAGSWGWIKSIYR